MTAVLNALSSWENFYVIVGSSAGALIGLQFVVITLIGDRATRGQALAGAAFGTPNVVHFGAVLLMSGILSAPWHRISGPAVLLGLLGAAGLYYQYVVARRMKTQDAYKPILEDWMFHCYLPTAAYATLIVSAIATQKSVRGALFGIGTASLALLFSGIHNAWDSVTYHVFVVRSQPPKE